MDEKPSSLFAGLDKALIRSTQPRQTEPIAAIVTAEPVNPTATSVRPATKKPTTGPRSKPQATAPATPDVTETSDEPDLIATIQRALKVVGKEIYYVRVTPEEKDKVDDLVHAFKRQGMRTSVNEIGRIALNNLLTDYETNGERSVLGRVLASKRA
jgi:hypothetical protein